MLSIQAKSYSLISICWLSWVPLSWSVAQNLVPNPSFEEVDSLPCDVISGDYNTPTIKDYVQLWSAPTGASADILSSLIDQNCYYSQFTEGQLPRTGTTMAGIYTLVDAGIEYREYLQIQLKEPLVRGKTYYSSMYVLRSRKTEFAVNNIGMYFSETAINRPIEFRGVLSFVPQVNETEIITDTEKWHLVSGCFTAESDARYLTIGNFYSDEETDTMRIQQYESTAYFFIDDVFVGEVDALPENFLGNDTLLCRGETVALTPQVPGASAYRWDDSSTEPTLLARVADTYWVDVTVGDCTIRDSITVTYEPRWSLGADTTLCQGETLLLSAPAATGPFLWSDNTTDSTLAVRQSGTYWVQTATSACAAGDTIRVGFTDCPGLIPTVFTPNQDAFNETFTIEHVAGRGWQLQVFNRWGKQVYATDNYRNDWDGQHLSAGVYYYLLKNQPLNRTYRGWVHLLRNPS